jgi:DNA-binding LytR/AlgR family response regulator
MRVLVVDDEPVARRRLVRMLEGMADVEVAGEAADGAQALARIEALRPDAVLLDIRMPGLDGLTLARTHEGLPPVIFTTAHEAHAVEAFEACAVDYLLKPVGRARLAQALAKVRLRGADHASVVRLLGELRERGRQAEERRIVAREGDSLRIFDAAHITRFFAADKYSVFVSEGKELLLEESLNALEERLGPHGFLRVHRAELVSLRHVRALHAEPGGAHLELTDGQRARVSRRTLPALRRALELDRSD